MLQEDQLKRLSDRLDQERAQLGQLQRDYGTITRSRFHALRMFWYSLKDLLGFRSDRDVYAAWSGVAVGTGVDASRAIAENHRTFDDVQLHLIESWTERAQSHPLEHEAPIACIIIPVYNKREVTVRCLQSIADTWFASLQVQIVVVDDASHDGTGEIIARLPGIDYVRSGKNEGFVRACNRGAAIARGKYLCFLNNDTEVRNAWLDHLVETAEADDSIGAVGSKLIYPDGRLQEAGGIIFRDASGWNYGRFDRPEDPRYNFLRDADYVSGAALMVRRDLFEQLRGFDERYRPAYYEDTDLCFGIRSLGYRVVFQPLSEVVHHEGLTSGTAESSGTKRYQEINRPKFREKWARELQAHAENRHENVHAAARRCRTGEVILVVDSFVPLYDREAGSQRLFHIVKLMRRLGYEVVFLPDNFAGLQPYTRELQQLGVEVLHHIHEGRSMREALDSALPEISVAWISRPDHFQKYEPMIRTNAATRIIYDTVDLYHVRTRRKVELLGGDDSVWKEWLRIELDCASRADATVVVTDDERQELEKLGVERIYTIPTVHEVEVHEARSFDRSSGLMFIGNYSHPPNADAATWLCTDVMPLILKEEPGIVLTLVGSNATDEIRALASRNVRVAGYVPDVAEYFTSARVFVAPLRWGAGMKGKIGHALSYRLPVVTTPIGTEGMGLVDGKNVIVSEADPARFAAAVLRVYRDRDLWTILSEASARAIQPYTPDAVKNDLARLLTQTQARPR